MDKTKVEIREKIISLQHCLTKQAEAYMVLAEESEENQTVIDYYVCMAGRYSSAASAIHKTRAYISEMMGY